MIDIENEVFTIMSNAIRSKYKSAYVTGEIVNVPSAFPCTYIRELENTVHTATSDSVETENHGDLVYEAQTFTNTLQGKKSQAKAIMQILDTEFKNLGFTRTMLEPIDNSDPSIFRMVGRWKATVSKDKTIYRR